MLLQSPPDREIFVLLVFPLAALRPSVRDSHTGVFFSSFWPFSSFDLYILFGPPILLSPTFMPLSSTKFTTAVINQLDNSVIYQHPTTLSSRVRHKTITMDPEGVEFLFSKAFRLHREIDFLLDDFQQELEALNTPQGNTEQDRAANSIRKDTTAQHSTPAPQPSLEPSSGSLSTLTSPEVPTWSPSALLDAFIYAAPPSQLREPKSHSFPGHAAFSNGSLDMAALLEGLNSPPVAKKQPEMDWYGDETPQGVRRRMEAEEKKHIPQEASLPPTAGLDNMESPYYGLPFSPTSPLFARAPLGQASLVGTLSTLPYDDEPRSPTSVTGPDDLYYTTQWSDPAPPNWGPVSPIYVPDSPHYAPMSPYRLDTSSFGPVSQSYAPASAGLGLVQALDSAGCVTQSWKPPRPPTPYQAHGRAGHGPRNSNSPLGQGDSSRLSLSSRTLSERSTERLWEGVVDRTPLEGGSFAGNARRRGSGQASRRTIMQRRLDYNVRERYNCRNHRPAACGSRSRITRALISCSSLTFRVARLKLVTNKDITRYEDGEVLRYGAGESYRPFNRDRERSPRRARSPLPRDRERERDRDPRDRDRDHRPRSPPPIASDSYVPNRSPRRRSRSPDRYRGPDRARDNGGESWRRRDNSRGRPRSPFRRASPRRSPRRSPNRYSPPLRRDERYDRARTPRRDFDNRDV